MLQRVSDTSVCQDHHLKPMMKMNGKRLKENGQKGLSRAVKEQDIKNHTLFGIYFDNEI